MKSSVVKYMTLVFLYLNINLSSENLYACLLGLQSVGVIKECIMYFCFCLDAVLSCYMLQSRG